MLALVEVAITPRYIDETLYLHEPSGAGKRGEERIARERIIARIVAKPGPPDADGPAPVTARRR